MITYPLPFLTRTAKGLTLAGALALLPVGQSWAGLMSNDLPDFTQLVEQNASAVVNISTLQKVQRKQNIPELNGIPEELLRRFFGDAFPPPAQGGSPAPKKNGKPEAQSLGTGFILSADGYIVTNHHVVADADEIIVRFSDRRELSAKVIGSDERTDVALLKVEAKNLPSVKIGQASKMKVGEWVVAIGSPFGFEATVTKGILSAKERALPDDTYVPFLQTDVPINPGNSGGPLFNMSGEVVGINSQIYSRSGGFMGLSFSIPIEVAMNAVQQIKQQGYVVRGYLGVNVQEVTQELSESFGMVKPKGALIAEVIPDTPASKAGLKAGDIIVSINGHEIARSGNLPPLVGMTPVGQQVSIGILRQGKEMTLPILIEALPDDRQSTKKAKTNGNPNKNGTSAGSEVLGAVVQPLDPAIKSKVGIDFGLKVTELKEGAFANSGIQVGDILLELNLVKLDAVDTLETLVAKLPQNQKVPLRIARGSKALFLPLVIVSE